MIPLYTNEAQNDILNIYFYQDRQRRRQMRGRIVFCLQRHGGRTDNEEKSGGFVRT